MLRTAQAIIGSLEPATRWIGAAVLGAALVGIAVVLAPGASSGVSDVVSVIDRSFTPDGPYPEKSEIGDATRFAKGRPGSVSFAVIGPKGDMHGYNERTQYSSASVSKSMLLAAYLRSHKGPLDPGISSTLRSMITVSDNDAASSIYAIVGDEGLVSVAKRAGMRDFEPDPGFWGGAQITAADMARFFFRLDDNLAGPHLAFGKHLLASIIGPQRWGIPKGAGGGWQIWFKGGWRPGGTEGTSGAVSHQAALLRYRNGAHVALAVLTNETPGEGPGGYGTIEGIAHRLLTPPPH
jgi:beta-lactamase class A